MLAVGRMGASCRRAGFGGAAPQKGSSKAGFWEPADEGRGAAGPRAPTGRWAGRECGEVLSLGCAWGAPGSCAEGRLCLCERDPVVRLGVKVT